VTRVRSDISSEAQPLHQDKDIEEHSYMVVKDAVTHTYILASSVNALWQRNSTTYTLDQTRALLLSSSPNGGVAP